MNKLFIVGVGPGNYENMTGRALALLEQSDVIVGYTLYADLIRDRFPEKEFFTTGMRQEVERVEAALRWRRKAARSRSSAAGTAACMG